jgi:mannobiose 2-epimerase
MALAVALRATARGANARGMHQTDPLRRGDYHWVMPVTSDALARLRLDAEREMRADILPYWAVHAVDETHGGFVGAVSGEGVPDLRAGKGGVLNARILWSYAAALRRYPEPMYRDLADRAYAYLLAHFWDPDHGGLFWEVDHLGAPMNTRKQTYGQAFGIYGLAEYFRATGTREALDRAIELFELIEAWAFDQRAGGYWEARGRDWKPIDDVRLSDLDMNVPFSMNTHLHVLEAYTTLAQAWDDPRPRARLRLLLDLFLSRIVDPSTAHQILFFDERWRARSERVSYGHDIETSWLLCEAAGILGDVELRGRAEALAVRMADAVLVEGFDREFGGVYNDFDAGHLDTDKDWWPQAEAVVGFLNAYRLSGRGEHLEAATRTWDFIDRHVLDHEFGEWYTRVSREGSPDLAPTKVDFWKCPYHNTRAMLEVVERAAHLAGAAPD